MGTSGSHGGHLSLEDVKRLATDAARLESPDLEVVAATAAGGEDSSEVFVTLTGCSTDPCRVILRVDRTAEENDAVSAIRDGLRTHFSMHRGHADVER